MIWRQDAQIGLRREAQRTRTPRIADGYVTRATCGVARYADGCAGAGGPARRVLPKRPATGKAGNGYPDDHERAFWGERAGHVGHAGAEAGARSSGLTLPQTLDLLFSV